MEGVKEKHQAIKVKGNIAPLKTGNEIKVAPEKNPNAQAIAYKIATEKQELEEAFQLVWDNYVGVGLQQDNHEGIRFTKYHLLPDTKVFIASYHDSRKKSHTNILINKKERVVGTVSLILDSPMGLPMEEFCGDEIAQLRLQGRRPAEVVAFALHPEYSGYKIFLNMFKLLFQFAEMKNVTDLCCSVTQRHINFYRKVCLFEPIGKLVPYSAAYKLKVQGHRLDMKKANKKARECYSGKEPDADLHRFFFAENYDQNRGEGKPLSNKLLKYFISEKTNFIDTLKESDLSCLREQYKKTGTYFPF